MLKALRLFAYSDFRSAAAGIQVRRRRIALAFEGRNLDHNLFLIVGNAILLLRRARFLFERRVWIIAWRSPRRQWFSRRGSRAGLPSHLRQTIQRLASLIIG